MTTNEDGRLERDLEGAFAVPVPPLEVETPESSRAAVQRRPGGRLRIGAVAVIAAAAVIGAVLVVPMFTADGAKTASAEELIERSIAASAPGQQSLTAYHTVSVSRSLGVETTTESWVGGDDRFKVESITRVDGAGARVDGTAMSNGEMWLWQGDAANPVVAHGPATIAVWPAPRGTPVADQLRHWTDNNCYKAEVTGTDTLAGRTAHVISVTATPESCPHEPKPLKQAQILIDTETDLPLKMQYFSDNPAGGSLFEVTLYETFASLDDAALRYTPPAGTAILEFRNDAELKQLLSNIVVFTVPMGSHVILGALPQPGSEPAAPYLTPPAQKP